ncbi:MAG: hypothetical protein ACE3JK_01810 [Sporolactobacillus sp.]
MTTLIIMITIPVVFSAELTWIGWVRGCELEERLRRKEQEHD